MPNSRLPYNRLDRFINRKKEELYRLLAVDANTSTQKLNQRSAKAAYLRKVILKAKAELAHIEAKLADADSIKVRLTHLEEQYQTCCKLLENQLTNSSTYRELSAEVQRLTPRIKVLKSGEFSH